MQRRRAIGLVAGSLTLLPRASHPQPSRKVWHIGYLSAGPRTQDGAPPRAFREALRELGYVESQNVTYRGGPTAQALKLATSTVPIVFAGAGDPVGVGLVPSLSRPGANITGISAQATELSAKRLELLKEMVPAATRIAVLWNASDPAMTLRYGEIERAAPVLRVAVQPLGVREPDDFASAFAAMTKDRPHALFLITDSLTLLNRKRVLEFAAAHAIPAIYEFGYLVRDGGLMSYGPDDADTLKRAALFIDRILKGAKPGDLPVEQPTRYYLLINLKTARALGLAVPQSLLLSADEVIRE
jgi:putative ABC transport system substrate-binding protein